MHWTYEAATAYCCRQRVCHAGTASSPARGTALALAAEGAPLLIAGRNEAALSGDSRYDCRARRVRARHRYFRAAASLPASTPRPVEVLINNAGGGCPYNLDALAAVQTPTRTTQWRLINDDWKLLVPSRCLRS